jgi:hypothetical protein
VCFCSVFCVHPQKAAWSELDKLVASGATPGPEHYNHLIRAEAASGAWRRARYMLIDAFTRPTWLPPNTDSLTSLLQGIVLSMDPGGYCCTAYNCMYSANLHLPIPAVQAQVVLCSGCSCVTQRLSLLVHLQLLLFGRASVRMHAQTQVKHAFPKCLSMLSMHWPCTLDCCTHSHWPAHGYRCGH